MRTPSIAVMSGRPAASSDPKRDGQDHEADHHAHALGVGLRSSPATTPPPNSTCKAGSRAAPAEATAVAAGSSIWSAGAIGVDHVGPGDPPVLRDGFDLVGVDDRVTPSPAWPPSDASTASMFSLSVSAAAMGGERPGRRAAGAGNPWRAGRPPAGTRCPATRTSRSSCPPPTRTPFPRPRTARARRRGPSVADAPRSGRGDRGEQPCERTPEIDEGRAGRAYGSELTVLPVDRNDMFHRPCQIRPVTVRPCPSRRR